jgi:hypothetical protein
MKVDSTHLKWPSSELLRRTVCYKFTNVSEVLAAFIIRAMSKHL